MNTIPGEYRQVVAQALERSGPNRPEIELALNQPGSEVREAMAFLVAYMPAKDLRSLSADYLARNVELALQARAEAPWSNQTPAEVFLNEVLPYAVLNEARDEWRQFLHDRFRPLVSACDSPGVAALRLNPAIFAELKVQYHPTLRPRTNQTPAESTAAGYASCTGLSILLIDTCRALGIPARAAGTPLWADLGGQVSSARDGNHTWVEIWDQGWHYLGAWEESPLDETWFTPKAAAADDSQPQHRIYASSWRKTGLSFMMAWDLDDYSVNALNVTSFYKRR